MSSPSKVRDIEVVADRTAGSRPDEGFLRVRRLRLRNVYADGSHSAEYACDIVSRPVADAVAIGLYERDEEGVRVLLKEGSRPPVYFRKDTPRTIPDARRYLRLVEMVAGLIEDDDGGADGLERRAAAEALEEAGVEVPLARVERLGDGAFASPGITDEKVYYCRADVTGLARGAVSGDGSVMEEGTAVVELDLREAIRQCRHGDIPDLKTEVGLVRLADALGYIPQLGMFVAELPPDLRARHDALGAR